MGTLALLPFPGWTAITSVPLTISLHSPPSALIAWGFDVLGPNKEGSDLQHFPWGGDQEFSAVGPVASLTSFTKQLSLSGRDGGDSRLISMGLNFFIYKTERPHHINFINHMWEFKGIVLSLAHSKCSVNVNYGPP